MSPLTFEELPTLSQSLIISITVAFSLHSAASCPSPHLPLEPMTLVSLASFCRRRVHCGEASVSSRRRKWAKPGSAPSSRPPGTMPTAQENKAVRAANDRSPRADRLGTQVGDVAGGRSQKECRAGVSVGYPGVANTKGVPLSPATLQRPPPEASAEPTSPR